MRKITKREDSLIRKYAKSIGMDVKVCIRVYLRGDLTQRRIDFIAMEATLWLKDKKKKGLLKPNKKGILTIELTDKLIQEFIKERYGSVDKMPAFFRTPLPAMQENKVFAKPKTKIKKGDIVIEGKAPDYIDKKTGV